MGKQLANEVIGTVAALAAVTVWMQLQDPESFLRLRLASAIDASRDAFRFERYRAMVEAQMHEELDRLLEGEAS